MGFVFSFSFRTHVARRVEISIVAIAEKGIIEIRRVIKSFAVRTVNHRISMAI